MILYKDTQYNYSETLLQGMQWDFLVLDVCVISFMARTVPDNSRVISPLMMGILVAYLLDIFLVSLRQFWGKKNIAKHTLADERFLI